MIAIKEKAEAAWVVLQDEEILYLLQEGHTKVRVFTTFGDEFLSNKNIIDHEKILNPTVFFRCDKDKIINVNHIRKIHYSDCNMLELKQGIFIKTSRRQTRALINFCNPTNKENIEESTN